MSLEESKNMDDTNEVLIADGEYGYNEVNLNDSNARSSIVSKMSKSGLILREKEGETAFNAALPNINVSGSIQTRQVSSPAVEKSFDSKIQPNFSIGKLESKQNKRVLALNDELNVSKKPFLLKIMI